MKKFSGIFASLLLCGCAPLFVSQNPAQPISMTQGAILVSIKIKGYAFPYFWGHYAHWVSFAQIGPDGRPDMDHLFYSSYHSGPYVYALNLPQGRYVPVAASYPFLGARDAVVFDQDTIKDWRTQVKPGEIAFMGENVIRSDWDDGVVLSTRTLTHLEGLNPFKPEPVILLESRLPTQDIGTAAQAAALRRACQDLRGTLWLPAAQQELEETGNPPPPLYRDFFELKPAVPIEAKTFSYYDLLNGWSGPFPIAGGLEWRQKSGKAAVAVTHVSPGEPGYKPVPDYLNDMRSAGTTEDDHVVSQIRISTQTAYSVLYTSYDYPQANLVGSGTRIYRTRTILVLADKGYYLVHYRALQDSFDKYYPQFDRFFWYLNLSPPPKPSDGTGE